MVQNLKIKEQIEVLWDQQKARRSHQNWGALRMGQGRTPSDSKVSVRNNRHQAHFNFMEKKIEVVLETPSHTKHSPQACFGADLFIFHLT